MKRLFYVGNYVEDDERSGYVCNVASAIKMRYIASAANRGGYRVFLFSLCRKSGKGFIRSVTHKAEQYTVKHIASFAETNILTKIGNRLLLYFQLVRLVISLKQDDTVLLYHSLRTSRFFSMAQKLKKLNVILEVEEIYACAADGKKPYYDEEVQLIKSFRKFIFVNDYIPAFFGIPKEQYILAYGAYTYKRVDAERFWDDACHVIYAGAIEKLNRGAFMAVDVAAKLPAGYFVHILGNGTDDCLRELQERIAKVNADAPREKVRYEGFFSGEELDGFLSRCDIGIGTYRIMSDYSNFIFPSKLVNYMCHGLCVVTGRSECYENASIAKDWILYNQNDPEEIAKAIEKANRGDLQTDSAQVIRQYDLAFVKSFKTNMEEGKWYA